MIFGNKEITEKQDIAKKRNYKVVKSNELIQKSRYNLSLQEQKVLHYIISQIKSTDTQFKRYYFSIQDFCKICGIDYTNGGNYVYIKNILRDMFQHFIWITIIENGEEKETILRFIEKPFINHTKKTIEIKLDDIMQEYLLQLKERFTEYNLLYILPMKSKYSPRIYEILKSYSNQKFAKTTVAKFRKMLMMEDEIYSNWSDFKKRILDKAINEINEFTDIYVNYKLGRQNRKISSIAFYISKKESDDLIATWENNKYILDEVDIEITDF